MSQLSQVLQSGEQMKRKPIAVDLRDEIVFYKEQMKDGGYSLFCGKCCQEAGDAEYIGEMSDAEIKALVVELKKFITLLEE